MKTGWNFSHRPNSYPNDLRSSTSVPPFIKSITPLEKTRSFPALPGSDPSNFSGSGPSSTRQKLTPSRSRHKSGLQARHSTHTQHELLCLPQREHADEWAAIG